MSTGGKSQTQQPPFPVHSFVQSVQPCANDVCTSHKATNINWDKKIWLASELASSSVTSYQSIIIILAVWTSSLLLVLQSALRGSAHRESVRGVSVPLFELISRWLYRTSPSHITTRRCDDVLQPPPPTTNYYAFWARSTDGNHGFVFVALDLSPFTK